MKVPHGKVVCWRIFKVDWQSLSFRDGSIARIKEVENKQTKEVEKQVESSFK